MRVEDLSLEDLEANIALIEQWFRDDAEIEDERYDDSSYKEPEPFLADIDQHRREREAMRKLLKILEDERDRRPTGASPV